MRLVGMNKNKSIDERKTKSRFRYLSPFRLELIHREEFQMSDVDVDVLKNFFRKKYQTLGEILATTPEDGSSLISSVQKLVRFGLLQRDWEIEDKMHESIVYSITREGKELALKELDHLELASS